MTTSPVRSDKLLDGAHPSERRVPDARAIPVRPTGSERPLFLVHEGAGPAAYAQALHPFIDAGIPVYALPAAPDSGPPLRTVEGMAKRMVRMIREVQPAGPYRLAGWSFGGILAYEIASQLIGHDQPVEFVGMMDTRCPAGPRAAAGDGDPFLRALREHFPRPLPIPVHLFPAREGADPDPRRGWQALLPDASLKVTPVPGTRLSMMEGENARPLGEALSREIALAAGKRRALPEDGYEPLVTLRFGRPGGAPLFCVPGAGASVTSFNELSAVLDPARPIHAFQPRGLDGEMVPHASVEAVAGLHLRALRELHPTGPVHLLGHSFGGWVVFEMAHRLRAAGRPVGSLTLLDSEVPDDPSRPDEYDGAEAFLKLVDIFELIAERPLQIGPREIDPLDEGGRLKLLHERLVRLGLMPGRSSPEVLRGPFRTFSACLRATYTPAGVYPDPVSLVLVRDTRLDEEGNQKLFEETVRGWRRWAPDLAFSVGAGNHMTALKEPHIRELSAHLARGLETGGRW